MDSTNELLITNVQLALLGMQMTKIFLVSLRRIFSTLWLRPWNEWIPKAQEQGFEPFESDTFLHAKESFSQGKATYIVDIVNWIRISYCEL